MAAQSLSSIAVAFGILLLPATMVFAQDSTGDASGLEVATITSAAEHSASDGQLPRSSPLMLAERSTPARPRWFLPIHAFTAGVQALDAYSTLKSVSAGRLEPNALVPTITGNRAALVGVKAGVAAAIILATDKMSRRHPVGAVLTAAAINSAYLVVSANNLQSVHATNVRFGR